MTQPRSDEPPVASGTDRGVGEVLLAMLSGSALAPFVQAIATKAGEDVHNKIKGLLGRHKADPKPGNPITLVDQRRAIVLKLPPTMAVDDAYDLANVRVPPVPPAQYLLVRYDDKSATWRAEAIQAPPADAIDIDQEP
jgi:hypothetical protein